MTSDVPSPAHSLPYRNAPEHLPESIVMSAEDMVDAALAGLEQGELITIPSLPSRADWDAFESARKALGPGLSRATPAARYGVAHRAN